MTAKVKKRLRIVCVVVVLVAALVPVAWWVAPGLLVVDTRLPTGAVENGVSAGKPLALVLLGGEPWTRPERGAEVYAECHAGLVVVSGEGDCEDVRRQLEARQVPPEAIVTECQSTSTFENAEFSIELIRERQIGQVVIVTSWYHSRRALACFEKLAPEIQFYSRPTLQPVTKSKWPKKYERNRILKEYAKLLYYWVVYGVNPL